MKKETSPQWLARHANYAGEPCLTWPFHRLPNGYGMFGQTIGSRKTMSYAHRFMCEIVNGPPPSPTHEAAHSCGRGKDGCVDPRHLSWKTISENALDCRRHGTQTRNRRGNRGNLTDLEVGEIRTLRGYLTQAEIALMFNTSQPTVRDIFSGRSRTKRRLRKPFTDEQVLEIRASHETLPELARQFRTAYSTIWRIRNGDAYKDVA